MLYFCLIADALIVLAGLYGYFSGSIPQTTPVLLAAIFGFIGFNMLVGSYFSYQKTRTWLTGTVRTTGEVVDFAGKESIDSFDRDDKRYDTVYYPVVRYQTQAGQVISFTSSVGSSKPDHAVGDRVNILYSPHEPQRAEVDEFMSLWLVPLVMGMIGMPMLVASAALTLVAIRI